MPKFGKVSRERLAQAHPDLQLVLNQAIEKYDFAIACSFRGQEEQHKCFLEGSSTVDWPNSKHNTNPSNAVDIVPCVNGKPRWSGKFSTESFALLAGFIIGIAFAQKIRVRWGHDWDDDGDLTDQTFIDSPHLEYIGRRS